MDSDVKRLACKIRLAPAGLVILMILFLLSPVAAWAVPAGQFTVILGQVDLLKLGAKQALPAQKGLAVEVGDIVRTKSHSKAQITLADQTVLNIGEDSRLQVKAFRFSEEEKQKKSLIGMFRGTLRSMVHRQADGTTRFEVETPTAVAAVRGTDFFSIVRSSVLSEFVVRDGHVGARTIIDAEDKMELLGAGEGARVEQGKGPVKRRVSQMEIDYLTRETDPQISKFSPPGDYVDAFIPDAIPAPVEPTHDAPFDDRSEPIAGGMPPAIPPITETVPGLLTTPITIVLGF